MALAQIVPPESDSAPSPDLAALLAQLYADQPSYGAPFTAALCRALEHVAAGTAYEPYNATHYRIQSASRPALWHYVTLHACGCEAQNRWCWHRALLHYLTAEAARANLDACPHPTLEAALLDLAACPRPTLAHIPPREPFDMDRVLREADELY